MGTRKMHADEVDTSAELVWRLLAAQFPEWADLPIEAVESAGTDHTIYRLGTDLSVRLPRIGWATGQADKEREWLPRLAPHLPLAIPEPLATGTPAEGYPWAWSVYRWVPGEYASADRVERSRANGDRRRAVRHGVATHRYRGGPRAADNPLLRCAPLAFRDMSTRPAIAKLEGMYDTGALTGVWEAALHAPVMGPRSGVGPRRPARRKPPRGAGPCRTRPSTSVGSGWATRPAT